MDGAYVVNGSGARQQQCVTPTHTVCGELLAGPLVNGSFIRSARLSTPTKRPNGWSNLERTRHSCQPLRATQSSSTSS
jgi:hypothetical protein